MGHNQSDTLKDDRLTLEQYFTAFNGNTMKLDKFCHILRFLHFSDNKNESDKTDEITTDCGKWELYLISSMTRMLNIRV